MNIPDQAIQAAAISLTLTGTMEDWEEMSDNRRSLYEHSAEAALEAALPHLEAALRKQIAADIRAEAERMPDRVTQEEVDGMNRAARIAEEGAFHCCAHPKCPGGSICCCPDAEEGTTK